MRVLIVDDEPIARRGLRRFLEHEPGVEVIGEAGSGAAAIDAIREQAPDLVFLDIQMPGMGGLEVVSTLGPRMPAVVFVTAFDRYAIEAFDRDVVDYVLKPVDPDRFRRALERARQEVARGQRRQHLVVRSVGRIQFVDVDDIDWLEAEDNYVRIRAGGAAYLMRETVTALEQRLDPERFLRVRRSTIVRIDRIAEARPVGNGTFELVLRDGTRVVSSRRFRDRIETLIDRLSR